MKTAYSCLTVLPALAVVLAMLPMPTASHAAAADEKDKLLRNHQSPYAHTAIGVVIDANAGKIPATGKELAEVLAKLGEFLQLPVPFSAVALHSGLTHPRVIITMRPSSHPGMHSVFIPDGNGFGWGGSSGITKMVRGDPTPLNSLAANRTQLEGRLFLAANTEADDTDAPRVKTVEFISWNTRKLKFDFGVIEGMGGDTPELKILDGVRCFTCHKNRGPILGVAPWSNTSHNTLVRNTSKHAMKIGNDSITLDGLTLLQSQGAAVDAAVRSGADILRDRAVLNLLTRTAEGRKALVLLFTTIATSGSLEKLDKPLRLELNKIDLIPFLREALVIQRTTAPSTLADFSPCGPVNKEIVTKSASGDKTNQVTRYDAIRAAGNPGLPTEHVPSNPKAFVRTPVKAPLQPSEVLSAVMVAQTMGLTEPDRVFLHKALEVALSICRIKNRDLTESDITRMVFTGPSFADVMNNGTLPDRDEFKDRFVAGVLGVLKTHDGGKDEFWLVRDSYTSAPKFDPNAKIENEAEPVPTTACLRCHDIRGVGKPAFNPIPMLAFNPFDPAGREAWLKTVDKKKKTAVLSRFVRRLVKDKDMPPEDSAEYLLYSEKDPAALNEVKEWLEAELKKTKGNGK